MTKLVAISFWAVVGISTGFAQYSEKLDGCLEKANTQLAMNICANEEARRADAELNVVYQKVLSAVGGQSAFIEKIRASEKAWIVYRDAYIDAMYPASDKQGTYGSIYPMEVNLLRAKLTQQQIRALKDLLKQYGESKP